MQCNCLKYNYLIFRTPLKGFRTCISKSVVEKKQYSFIMLFECIYDGIELWIFPLFNFIEPQCQFHSCDIMTYW
jgi:hypothetical protein